MAWRNLKVLAVVSMCHGDLATANGKVMLVDDYGHHPTEMAATMNAVRTAWPNVVWWCYFNRIDLRVLVTYLKTLQPCFRSQMCCY